MKELVEALQVFLKYGNPKFPTHCSHYVLFVDIKPELVSWMDKRKLEELHFDEDEDGYGFVSTWFGSC